MAVNFKVEPFLFSSPRFATVPSVMKESEAVVSSAT